MGDPNSLSIHARAGTRRFRRNARITVHDGKMVITDRRRRSRSFPLDDSPERPAYLLAFMPSEDNRGTAVAVADGKERLLANVDVASFGYDQLAALEQAAGLTRKFRMHPAELGPWHPEGLQLLDTNFWAWGPVAGPIGFAVGATANAGFLPKWLGLPLLGISFAYLMGGLFSGAYTWHIKKPKGAPAEQAERFASEPGDAPGEGSQR